MPRRQREEYPQEYQPTEMYQSEEEYPTKNSLELNKKPRIYLCGFPLRVIKRFWPPSPSSQEEGDSTEQDSRA